jgi:hypothetical protein
MPYMIPKGAALEKTCEDFSDDELETILKFMEKANHNAVDVIANTRKAAKK